MEVFAVDTKCGSAHESKIIVDHANERISYFENRAGLSKFMYYATRGGSTILAAMLPVFAESDAVIFQSIKISVIMSLLIALFSAIDIFWRPGELWRHNRLVQRELESCLWTYRSSKLSPGEEKNHALALHDAVSAILKKEVRDYWRIRPLASHREGDKSEH